MPLHEIDREFLKHIRAEFARQHLALAIAHQHRIPIAALDLPRRLLQEVGVVLPDCPLEPGLELLIDLVPVDAHRRHQRFLKPVLPDRIGLVVEIVHLPLAGNRGLVTGIAQHAGNGRLALPIESAAAVQGGVVMQVPAGAKGIAPGEELHPARTANRGRVTIGETHAGRRQPVDLRRAALFAAVTVEPLLPEIIQQDEYDVRPGRGRGGRRGATGEDQSKNTQQDSRDHGPGGCGLRPARASRHAGAAP